MNQYLSIIIVTIKESGHTKMDKISCFGFILWLLTRKILVILVQ